LFVVDGRGILAFDPTRNRKRRVVTGEDVGYIEAISSDGEYIGTVSVIASTDGSRKWKLRALGFAEDVFLP
jgi:hypothetical protein